MILKKPAPELIRVGTGFRKRSCSNNNLKRDDDSKRSHHALGLEQSARLNLGLPLGPAPIIETAARDFGHVLDFARDVAPNLVALQIAAFLELGCCGPSPLACGGSVLCQK